MPEHIRALVVILVVASAVFWLAERPLCQFATAAADYKRRRNLWFGVTLAVFLAHNYWLYVLACCALLAYHSRREPNPLALFCVVLFAAPPLENTIPGLGLITSLFELNHLRLTTLAVLLPAAIRLWSDPTPRDASFRVPDALLSGYLLLLFVMQAVVDSATGTLRATFCFFLDIWLPYYVASRTLRNLAGFRDMVAALVLTLAIMAALAAFESLRSWLLYGSVRSALGLNEASIGTYIFRSEGGALRANVSAGNAIVLGYLMMIGLGLLVFLRLSISNRGMLLATGALAVGLLAALSRGPWVGTVALLFVALGLGPGVGRRLAWLIGGGGLVFGLVVISPLGDKVIDLLPFVGTVDEFNVQYRQRLFDVSQVILWQNPWFGAFDYMLRPEMEQMRQGQGIIDIVNSYIAVALAYGLVGLVLFVAPFAHSFWTVWCIRRKLIVLHPEGETLGRALLGTLVGVLITIATASSIMSIPVMYWVLVGACAAYARFYAKRAT